MRVRLTAVALAISWWATGIAAADPAPPAYYLALGDSLAIGVQPRADGDVPTDQGYADDLHALYRLKIPRLRLAKLGCSGETTSTMLAGGVCDYPLGNQLTEAVHFIQTHRVALITLDIGGDNILHCISASGIDPDCVNRGLGALQSDLPQILATLRAAAGHSIPIVAMNYYDAFLAAWRLLPAPAGPALAVASLQVTLALNAALETLYRAFGVPVAQVADAYRITNFTIVPFVGLPLNVGLALTWTWMGQPPPLGADIHPNVVGYGVIAAAFVKAIER